MDKYDITKLDLYHLSGLGRGEVNGIHSFLLFLYSKYHLDPKITFKYAEINWMSPDLLLKIINKTLELELISLIQRPTKKEPMIISLKTNEELQIILNLNKKIEFEKYKNVSLSKEHLAEILGCREIGAFFDTKQISSWIRNVNRGVWNKNKFLMLLSIISLFGCDYKIKSATLNKYSALPTFFKSVSFLYGKLAPNKQEILYRQLENSLNYLNKKSNGSFVDMAKTYLNSI